MNMNDKKYLPIFIAAFLLIFSSCTEQGNSFLVWRKTTDKTMMNIFDAYLNISADKDTATYVGMYFSQVEGKILNISDSVQVQYFGHCYSTTNKKPTVKDKHTIFKADTIPGITAETKDFSFKSDLNNLVLDTPYFVRSFVIIKYNSGRIDTGYNQSVIEFRTKAQNLWFHKIDFNGDARTEATSFVMDNKAYIIGGWDGVTLRKDLWQYTPDNGVQTGYWSQESIFTGGARMSAAAFVINDTVYYGTGIIDHNAGTKARDMWKWTVAGGMYNSWRRIDSLGEHQERANCVAFTLKDKYGVPKGYIGLGTQTYPTSDIYWYDQSRDGATAAGGAAWVLGARLGNGVGVRRTEATVAVINNRAIVGAGKDENGVLHSDFYMLDPTIGISGTWSTIPQFPGGGRTNAVSFAISFTRPRTGEHFNYLYFGTGKDASGKLYRDWWRYDFSTKKWEQVMEMREKNDYADPREGAIAFTIILPHADFGTVERGFVALGKSATTYKKDVWEYLP